jgi:SAM-dependent methyltransferase
MKDPYKSGSYFNDSSRHLEDAEFKVASIWRVLYPILQNEKIPISSYADVGCGSGELIKKMSKLLEDSSFNLSKITGFDISPHVINLKMENITFLHEDFCARKESYDLVTLTDVFEHVPAPIEFIRKIGELSKIVAFHIPLDDCWAVNVRNLQRSKIKNPGHLVFLDVNSALNMITIAGLKILDFDYSRETLKAPSNLSSKFQKLFFPFKFVLFKISPWLASKVFGFSLVVVAALEK